MAMDHAGPQPDDRGFSFGDVEGGWNGLVDRIDRFQRRRRPLAFAWGVAKRYTEDNGNHFAALVSYYAFFSIFPLLLVLVTTLGIVLADHPDLRQRIVDSAVAQFPVVGQDIADREIDGRGIVLVLGLLTTLYAGLRAVDALQHAMNTMWNVPRYHRPNLLKRKLRDVAVVGVLGVGVIGATVSSGLGAFVPMPALGRTFSLLGTAAVNVGVLILVFRLLTNCPLGVKRIVPGALLGGMSLMGLQVLGGVYVRDVVKDAGDTYGIFAIVLGLLAWVTIQARIVLIASEVNVVISDHLWPRGMSNRDPTPADLLAYRLSTEREARLKEEAAHMGMAARPLDTA
jgi:inner membrane protein YhjD